MSTEINVPLQSPPAPDAIRLAILLSGGGRTLQNLADAINTRELDAKIVSVISSRSDAYGLTRAANLNLPAHTIERKAVASTSDFSNQIWQIVRRSHADLVCLAGFLSLLEIPTDYAGRVINIHPALLPSFGGKGMFGHHVHQAVLAAGCKISGCTVHFCDQNYDSGQIILQRTCPVDEDDTPDSLAARVFASECVAYPQAVSLVSQGRVIVQGRVARVLPHVHDVVQRAKKYSEVIHLGRLRDAGRPYATHPAAVALSLYEHGVRDPDTLAAAYLHDALEDLPACRWPLQRAFGQTIAAIVRELTIPPELDNNFEQKHAYLAHHAKTMSPQAKLIKLADRAHNILDLPQKSPDKRPRYARASAELLEALKPWPIEPLAKQIQQHIKPYL